MSPPTVSVFGSDTARRGEEGYEYKDPRKPGHNGVDVIPSRFYGNNAAMVGAPVYALFHGHVARGAADDNYRAYLRIGATATTVNDVEYELVYSHIKVRIGASWANIVPGEEIGTIMDITQEDPDYKQGEFNHLHLEIRRRANKYDTFDPEFLLHPVGG